MTLAAITAACGLSTHAFASAPHLATSPIKMGYYADWNIYHGTDNYFPGAVNPNTQQPITNDVLSSKISKLNTVTYAFLEVDSTGSAYFFDTWADLSSKDLNFCKANSAICAGHTTSNYLGYGDFDAMAADSSVPNKFISIGGFGHSDSWTYAQDNPQVFADSIVTIIKQFPSINGIDLDAEPLSSVNPTSFIAMAKTLRTTLDNNGMNQVVISFPIAANPGEISDFGTSNWKDLMKYVSYVSLMGYDLHGEFDVPAVTGLQSGLYPAPNSQSDFDDNDAYQTLKQMGVASEDIILGVPTYARAVGGVTTDGLDQTFTTSYHGDLDTVGCTTQLGQGINTCGGMESNNGLYALIGSQAPQNVNANNTIIGAYVDNGGNFFSFDSYQSAQAKGEFAKTNGMAGWLAWDLSSAVPVTGDTANESVINGLDSGWG